MKNWLILLIFSGMIFVVFHTIWSISEENYRFNKDIYNFIEGH
jgi:hypothetical protein